MSAPLKIGLGTAQLGLDYGVANAHGRPADDQARAILRLASDGGVSILDTAPGYGDSEARIAACRPGDSRFRVVTKTCVDSSPAKFVADVQASLARLDVTQLHGLLIHDAAALHGHHASACVAALREVKAAGLARRVGLSVYDADQAQCALDTDVVDLIQLPLNVLDQRLVHDGTLARLHAAGVEIHARSVFLQGALLFAPDEAPAHLRALAPHLRRLHTWCAGHDLTPLEVALGFVHALDDISVALVGVDRPEHLDAILTAARRVTARGLAPEAFASLAVDDEQLLNPSKWRSA